MSMTTKQKWGLGFLILALIIIISYFWNKAKASSSTILTDAQQRQDLATKNGWTLSELDTVVKLGKCISNGTGNIFTDSMLNSSIDAIRAGAVDNYGSIAISCGLNSTDVVNLISVTKKIK